MTMLNPTAGTLRDDRERSSTIPKDAWREFLDDFSRLHAETTARLELIDAKDTGPGLLVEDRPFLSITLDEEAGPRQVILEFGDTGGGSPAALRHIASDPKAIWVHEASPGIVDAIEIQTASDGALVLTINPHPGRASVSFEDQGRSELSLPPGGTR